jgi:hypothetical protein
LTGIAERNPASRETAVGDLLRRGLGVTQHGAPADLDVFPTGEGDGATLQMIADTLELACIVAAGRLAVGCRPVVGNLAQRG